MSWLGLGNNPITDVSPLAGLTNLKWLILSENQITDVRSLAKLTNLEEFYLTDNPLAQSVCPISPPTVCKFEELPPAKTY
ncbi:MAG TPA: leucine-rich repeat domain-containing protein [Candidatus Sericytochromatia bacterium]